MSKKFRLVSLILAIIMLVSNNTTIAYANEVIDIEENIADEYEVSDLEIDELEEPIEDCTDDMLVEQEEKPEEDEYIIENQFAENSDWGDILEEDQSLFISVEEVPDSLWVAGINEEGYDYTGDSIRIPIRVYDAKTLLKEGTDYQIAYKNNKNANDASITSTAPTIIITGKGNYSGRIVKYFKINTLDIRTKQADGLDYYFLAPDIKVGYNGKVQKSIPSIKCVYPEKTIILKNGVDYTCEYPGTDAKKSDYDKNAFKQPDIYEIKVTGKGNYIGDFTVNEQIMASGYKNVKNLSVIVSAVTYTGEELTPEVIVKNGNVTLVGMPEDEYDGREGISFTYRYENNIEVGKGHIIITGCGMYYGERTVDFTIKGKSIKDIRIAGFTNAYVYSGQNTEQSFATVEETTDGETGEVSTSVGDGLYLYFVTGKGASAQYTYLKKDVDYRIIYSGDRKKVGTVTVSFVGMGCYKDTIKKAYKILPYDINNDTYNYPDGHIGKIVVTDEKGDSYPQTVQYHKNGVQLSPKVTFELWNSDEILEYSETLIAGRDYNIGFLNNKSLGDITNKKNIPTIRITGIKNFKGKREKEKFSIVKQNIVTSGILIKPIDRVYSDKRNNYQTTLSVYDANGKKLVAGTDYKKTFNYFYENETVLGNGITREAGEQVQTDDIVPAYTYLRVEITGTGNYEGNAFGLYRIVKYDIAKTTATIAPQYYTGREIVLDKAQIVLKQGKLTINPVYYNITGYTNNRNKGVASVSVEGVGLYGGSKIINFKIVDKSFEYLIGFNGNGATSGSMKDIIVSSGKELTLPANTFIRNNYKFVGWNTKSDGSGDSYSDKALFEYQANKNGIRKVLYAQWDPGEVSVSSISLNYAQLTGSVGDNYKLVATISPIRATNKAIRWESSKRSVVSVDSEGNLTLKAPGIALVKAYAEDGVTSGQCLVKVSGWDRTDLGDTYINAAEYIEAAATVTEGLNEAVKALDDNIRTLYIPEGVYEIDALKAVNLKNDMRLIMDEGTVLKAIPNNSTNYNILRLSSVENVSIYGGQIVGERDTHIGTSGEWGHGIGVYDSKNIKISNVNVSDCWGDGIYLGSDAEMEPNRGCNNIEITKCTMENNRRNNLSVVSADNVIVYDSTLSRANGAEPATGCDVETNNHKNPCEHISFYNCSFINNNGGGFSVITEANDVVLSGCKMDGQFINFQGSNVGIDNTSIDSEMYARIGIILGENVKINDGSPAEDILVVTYNASEDIGRWFAYGQNSNNKMTCSIVDDPRSESGVALRIERTTKGDKECGFYINLSDIMTDGNIAKLRQGKKYRFEYVTKSNAIWGIKSTQTGYYWCISDSNRYRTGFVTQIAETDENCRLQIYAMDKINGMFIDIESIKIYEVQ